MLQDYQNHQNDLAKKIKFAFKLSLNHTCLFTDVYYYLFVLLTCTFC